MHHYECVALCQVNSLQEDQLWAASLATSSSMSKDYRSSAIFLSQVEQGCPVDLLQNSGGCSEYLVHGERSHDLIAEESGGCSIFSYVVESAFLTKSCHWTLRTRRRHHWSSASIRCTSACWMSNASTHRTLLVVYRHCLGLGCNTWSPQMMVKTLHSSSDHGTELQFTAGHRTVHTTQLDKLLHTLHIVPTYEESGRYISCGVLCSIHFLVPVSFKSKCGSFFLKDVENRNNKFEHLGKETCIIHKCL